MNKLSFPIFFLILTGYLLFTQNARAQQYVGKKGEIYFSWGYNEEWYTHSNIHISQPSLGNNYTFKNILAVDKPGWNGQFFHKPLSIPQYNYRIGYFFKNNWALELNFDHAKYVVSPHQLVHVTGMMSHQPVDQYIGHL